MALIATASVDGRPQVITKLDGDTRKVSCSCCNNCCRYRADKILAGLLPDEYLPASIRFQGVSLPRIEEQHAYGNTDNGIIYESGVWAKYSNGVRTEHNCLLGNVAFGQTFNPPTGAEDEFPSTLYVDATEFGAGTAVLTRVTDLADFSNVCAWNGQNNCGGFTSILYFRSNTNSSDAMSISFRFCPPTGGQPGNSFFRADTSTPLGEYTQAGATIYVT